MLIARCPFYCSGNESWVRKLGHIQDQKVLQHHVSILNGSYSPKQSTIICYHSNGLNSCFWLCACRWLVSIVDSGDGWPTSSYNLLTKGKCNNE